jgi:cyclic pyranopterin phosphate synthase
MIDYRIDGHKLDLHPERVAAWMRGEKVYPLYLEIAPSGGCNHRCTFCAVDYLGYRTRFLDVVIMKERLWEMGQLGVKSIMWAGEGEPLLHRQLDEMIIAGKACGIDQAITTNGVALTERFCRAALPSIAWIKVSINAGSKEDYLKIHKAQPNDWLRLWINLTRAVRVREELGASVSLGAQIVLLPDNAAHVRELAYMCRDTGLDYLVIKPYSQHPKSETRQYEGLRYEMKGDDANHVQPMRSRVLLRDDTYLPGADSNSAQVADVPAWADLSTDDFRVIVRTETMPRVTGARDYATCQATPWFWGYIMATGDVYGCSAYLGDARFRYGNILEQDFASIWNSPAKRGCETFVRDELDIKDCRKACRMDHANRYLWRVTHPEKHDAFV